MAYAIKDTMLPAVKEFLTARNEINAQWDKDYDAYEREYSHPYSEAAHKRYRALSDELSDNLERTWDILRNSDHSLLKWIPDGVLYTFREEALRLITILTETSTIRQLDEFAKAKHWCDKYDLHRARAMKDGAFRDLIHIQIMVPGSDEWVAFAEYEFPNGSTVNPETIEAVLREHSLNSLTMFFGEPGDFVIFRMQPVEDQAVALELES